MTTCQPGPWWKVGAELRVYSRNEELAPPLLLSSEDEMMIEAAFKMLDTCADGKLRQEDFDRGMEKMDPGLRKELINLPTFAEVCRVWDDMAGLFKDEEGIPATEISVEQWVAGIKDTAVKHMQLEEGALGGAGLTVNAHLAFLRKAASANVHYIIGRIVALSTVVDAAALKALDVFWLSIKEQKVFDDRGIEHVRTSTIHPFWKVFWETFKTFNANESGGRPAKRSRLSAAGAGKQDLGLCECQLTKMELLDRIKRIAFACPSISTPLTSVDDSIRNKLFKQWKVDKTSVHYTVVHKEMNKQIKKIIQTLCEQYHKTVIPPQRLRRPLWNVSAEGVASVA